MKEERVLIVDDVPENIAILMELLKDDYFVQVATSGEKALSLMKRELKPDIILLDVVMPILDGYGVLKKIKSDPLLEDIPVIFITSKNEEIDEDKGLAMGAVDYIRKPYDAMLVKQRVKSHLLLKTYKGVLLDHSNQGFSKEVLIERYKKLFDDMKDGIVITTLSSEIIWANEVFSTQTGYQLKELIGENIKIINSGFHSHEFYEEMWSVMKEKGYWMGIIWNKSKDQQTHQNLLTIIGCKECDEELFYIGVYSDLSG